MKRRTTEPTENEPVRSYPSNSITEIGATAATFE
jgi:hypothetical protein